MSNYVYNDNFANLDSNNNSSESNIQKKKSSPPVFLFVATALISLVFGLLGGLLVGGTSKPTERTSVEYRSPVATQLANENKNDMASLVEKIRHSVVEIQTEYVVHSSFYQAVKSGAGSGVIVGEYKDDGTRAGYNVITNAHVIEGEGSDKIASKITVILTDGTEYEAKCVGYDTVGDIAVIRIEESKRELYCASFSNTNSLRVGDSVIAIGNPLGELGGSVTSGIISALDREISIDGNVMNLLQTNAAINPGNSGGGLFDLSGNLVGIVNAKSSGTGIEGLGFAIPSEDASKMYRDIIEYGFVKGRSTIGVNFAEYIDRSVRVYSLESGYNEKVFRTYDKIVAVNGKEISSASEISDIVRKSKIGSKIAFTIIRDKATVTVEATVFEYQPK